MKTSENLIETLMYLFERYLVQEIFLGENITLEMLKAGYHPQDIKTALDWLNKLDQGELSQSKKTIRIYSKEEEQKLTPQARTYLRHLEQLHIIDSHIRELIIHSAMMLETSCIDLPEIQCISLIILYKHPKKRKELELLEHLVLLDKYEEIKH
ncbi:MAG: DUF494 family protein [Gammaproteobacteria bacterium]|nr:DUF494 family protein [Gammaproteobacteria bacterium]